MADEGSVAVVVVGMEVGMDVEVVERLKVGERRMDKCTIIMHTKVCLLSILLDKLRRHFHILGRGRRCRGEGHLGHLSPLCKLIRKKVVRR